MRLFLVKSNIAGKLSFEEAMTIFSDFFAKMFYDDDHSIDERREIIVGYSSKNSLLPVYLTQGKSKL